MNTDYRIRTVVPFEHYFILNKDIRKFMKEVLSIKNIEIMNLRLLLQDSMHPDRAAIYFCTGNRFSCGTSQAAILTKIYLH